MYQPTDVLIPASFADASSYVDVFHPLLEDGVRVVTQAVPNRSLNGDAAYLGAVHDAIPGPVVLVGQTQAVLDREHDAITSHRTTPTRVEPAEPHP